MYYTIYKTTNLINGKYYIGKHQTRNLDDGYVGSGKRLKYAIKKYGIENFVTDILFIYDEEWKMNLAEKILVVPDVETNYNLCPGGQGGFGYLNVKKLNSSTESRRKSIVKMNAMVLEKRKTDPVYNEKYCSQLKENAKKSTKGNYMRIKHTETTKLKMRKSKNVGENNSQFGTCWITNQKENKKIKISDLDFWIARGYKRGRI